MLNGVARTCLIMMISVKLKGSRTYSSETSQEVEPKVRKSPKGSQQLKIARGSAPRTQARSGKWWLVATSFLDMESES